MTTSAFFFAIHASSLARNSSLTMCVRGNPPLYTIEIATFTSLAPFDPAVPCRKLRSTKLPRLRARPLRIALAERQSRPFRPYADIPSTFRPVSRGGSSVDPFPYRVQLRRGVLFGNLDSVDEFLQVHELVLSLIEVRLVRFIAVKGPRWSLVLVNLDLHATSIPEDDSQVNTRGITGNPRSGLDPGMPLPDPYRAKWAAKPQVWHIGTPAPASWISGHFRTARRPA